MCSMFVAGNARVSVHNRIQAQNPFAGNHAKPLAAEGGNASRITQKAQTTTTLKL